MTSRLRQLIAASAISAASVGVGVATDVATDVAPVEAANCTAWWFPASGGANAGATSYCSDHAHKVRVWCTNGGSYVGNYASARRYSFVTCPWGTGATRAVTILV